ncbi:TRAP transporter small permease [Psychromarinibacter sp. C21-152]|uniref:TRAP transporter small permease protein n=1 Tax=Psychromarinibacter sediminicola TaxID=3033385 RepID=A0AAE3NTA3_9RHOB|nr:TRAP transporter small permease [Psychromarinibacter sediminicola]MDF0602014.1 TRAP transporter small permease [Psychromarinibacter sediminicola]
MKRLLDLTVNAAAWVAAAAAILMMLHVTVDVAGRTLFHAPLTGTLEIVANYHMAALAFLPLALIAREKGHIIVELFTGWMRPGPRRILDGLVGIITVAYVGVFTWKAVDVAIDKTRIRDAKEAGFGFVEVWPARWFVVAGFGLMALYVAIHVVRDLRAGLSGGDGDDTDNGAGR